MQVGSRTNQANELYLDACMFKSPAVFGTYSDRTLYRFAVHIEWRLLPPVLVQLDIDSLSVVGFLKHDVDVDRSRKEVGGHSGDRRGLGGKDRPLRTTDVLKVKSRNGEQRRGRSFVVEPTPNTADTISGKLRSVAPSPPRRLEFHLCGCGDREMLLRCTLLQVSAFFFPYYPPLCSRL